MRLILLVLAFLVLAQPNARAQTATLKTDIVAAGESLTLGDLFNDAGAAAGRIIAPAPPPGRASQFSALFVKAAANAAGLTWSPPPGVDAIIVRSASAGASPASAPGVRGETIIKRNDMITLVYETAGVKLTTRARALGDAPRGAMVRVINLASNRTVEAIAIAPATASANLNAR
jgi:flagella basal body P-ring formation protein FlgA